MFNVFFQTVHSVACYRLSDVMYGLKKTQALAWRSEEERTAFVSKELSTFLLPFCELSEEQESMDIATTHS